MVNKPPFQRILMKFSGETLLGEESFGISSSACQEIASLLHHIQKEGFQIGVVIGGGNIFRGHQLTALGIPRTPADQMGMLATLMNGLALKHALDSLNCPTRLLTGLDCPKVADSFTWQRARQGLEQGEIVLFVGGTGSSHFTTDTAAALRAAEMEADVLIKATKVDGIYSEDPVRFPQAKKYDRIPYSQVLAENLQVMDATSIALCHGNQIPIFVFRWTDLHTHPLGALLFEKGRGTWITQ